MNSDNKEFWIIKAWTMVILCWIYLFCCTQKEDCTNLLGQSVIYRLWKYIQPLRSFCMHKVCSCLNFLFSIHYPMLIFMNGSVQKQWQTMACIILLFIVTQTMIWVSKMYNHGMELLLYFHFHITVSDSGLQANLKLRFVNSDIPPNHVLSGCVNWATVD